MISVVVLAPGVDGGDASRILVARSLGWLVSAVVAGVVADVTLASAASSALSDVAESTGCCLVEGEDEAERLHRAVQGCRRGMILVIRAGFQPFGPLVDEIDERLRSGPVEPAALLVAPQGIAQRLRPPSARTVGVLATGERWRLAGFAALARACRRRDRFATRLRRIG